MEEILDSNRDAQHIKSQSSQGLFAALKDILSAFLYWPIVYHLTKTDIKKQYTRTVIGPFWTTLHLGLFIGCMGYLFSHLWKTNVGTFLPFFCSGYLVWNFVSSLINDGCQTYVTSTLYLKNLSIPQSTYPFRVVLRGLIQFAHQVVVFIIVAAIFHVPITRYTLLVIPALFLIVVNGLWFAIVFGYFCARFRDIQQIIKSILQVSLFVTPIFWPISHLGTSFKAYLLVNGNPLYHFVAIVRNPLLGTPPSALNWIVVLGLAIGGWLLATVIVSRYRNKLIFWV